MSDPIETLLSITWWRTVFQKFGRAFGWGCAVVFAIPLVMVGVNQLNTRGSQTNGAVARDTVLMTVNGESISMGDYYAISQHVQMGAPGQEFARKTGQIVDALVKQAVIAQEAKRVGVKASDAEVDKAIQDMKVRVLGKNATDTDLENYVSQNQHMTLAELRDEVAKESVGQALLADVKKKTIVTEEEARNQTAEVRLTVVLIPTVPTTPSPFMPPSPKALPDAAAKQKAEELLAKVKSGQADIAKVAKAESGDYTNSKGGDTDFRPEYKSPGQGMPASMGNLTYGPEFDEAVHKAKEGDYVGVIKASGFQSGYLFAKIAARRNNTPKDFVAQKVVDQLKAKRASEALSKKIEDMAKVAKVEFPADRLEEKAYYDFYRFSKLDEERMMSFSNPAAAPSEAEINKQKAATDAEIEAVYKKDPANTTAATLILDSIKLKLADRKTTPAEQTQMRERLLPLYQTVIKAGEGDGYSYRFGLGDALHDKKQFAEAYKNYHQVGKLMDLDFPTDLKAMQEAKQERQRLAMALKSVASPEAPLADAESAAQAAKIQALDASIIQAQMKAAEEKRVQDEMQKKVEQLKSKPAVKTGAGAGSSVPDSFGKSLDLSGAVKSPTAPPVGEPLKAPVTPGKPAPGSQPASPPAAGGTGR